MNRRSFLALLGLAPLTAKVVDDEDDEIVDPADCFHVNTYRIERVHGDAFELEGEIIASGFLQIEGEYCRDCGTRLGDL